MLIGNKSAVRTPEFHKKKERERMVKNALIVLGTIVVIVLPIYALRTQKLQIQNIHLAGNTVTKDEDIQRIVAQDLEGNYAWFFPRSGDVVYPAKKIEADLLRAIPRLASVDVSLTDPRTLRVSVSERMPVALYCKDVSVPSAPAGCYFIDDQGFIFSEAPSFSPGVYQVYAEDPSLDAPLGQTYLAPAAFAPLTPFLKSLGEIGLYPKAFVIKNGEYHLVLSNGGEIIFMPNADLELVHSNLSSLVVNPSFQKDGSLNTLRYIDLRFGNKIFYKFNNA